MYNKTDDVISKLCFTVSTVFKSNPLPNSLVTVNENDEINKITFEGRRT